MADDATVMLRRFEVAAGMVAQLAAGMNGLAERFVGLRTAQVRGETFAGAGAGRRLRLVAGGRGEGGTDG